MSQLDYRVSVITKVESLGYHKILPNEKAFLEIFFDNTPILELNGKIYNRAITIRQTKKTQLGDALIAATALERGLPLWTHNSEDFAGIAGLEVHDPIGTIAN